MSFFKYRRRPGRLGDLTEPEFEEYPTAKWPPLGLGAWSLYKRSGLLMDYDFLPDFEFLTY